MSLLTRAATALGMNFLSPLVSSQDSEPTVSILPATLLQLGAVKPDGTSTTVAPDGTLSATASGFPNPMTAKGDLIAGGVAGAPARLPVGANGKVLTANSAATDGVDWETPAAPGMTNPMTTLGDVILGGAAGAPARLPVGANGKVLTANSAATDGVDWETPAAPANPTQTAVLAADFQKTNSTFANITGFSFALVNGVTYTFEAMLIVTPSATGGSKFLPNFGAATITGYLAAYTDINQSTNVIANSAYTQNPAANIDGQAGELQLLLRIYGSFVCTGSGTLTLQFAQEVTNATLSAVVAGSYMKIASV